VDAIVVCGVAGLPSRGGVQATAARAIAAIVNMALMRVAREERRERSRVMEVEAVCPERLS
jgi:hypothetical protein